MGREVNGHRKFISGETGKHLDANALITYTIWVRGGCPMCDQQIGPGSSL